jgi:hypothetical protein
MIKFLKSNWVFSLFSIISLIFILLCSGNIFFWDTVQLGSRHAYFYYENNLKLAFLPNHIDSGHIPTFGYLLALLWTVFGKTLLVSHLYIYPFVVGIIWQLIQILKKYISSKYIFWSILLLFADTTFLSQISLVSPDIPLLFFFLLAINSILKNNRILLSTAIASLFLISMRGMILSVPLFLFDTYLNTKIDKRYVKNYILQLIKNGLHYIPAAIIFITFNYLHFKSKGWFGYHENSPWAIFFQRVELQEAIKNFFIFGWRIVDFGRIFIWLGLFIALFFIPLKQLLKEKKSKQITLLFILIISVLSIPAIIYLDLKGHRYFMPIYISFSLVFCYFVFEKVKNKSAQKLIYTFTLVGLISGSFWVYPKHVSQGWDSTLAHLPYYNLRKKMVTYIEKNNIQYHEVGSDFPDSYEDRFLTLSDKSWLFPEKDLTQHQYILYANVCNEFTDDELLELKTNWEAIKADKLLTVEMVLYKNPNYNL